MRNAKNYYSLTKVILKESLIKLMNKKMTGLFIWIGLMLIMVISLIKEFVMKYSKLILMKKMELKINQILNYSILKHNLIKIKILAQRPKILLEYKWDQNLEHKKTLKLMKKLKRDLRIYTPNHMKRIYHKSMSHINPLVLPEFHQN